MHTTLHRTLTARWALELGFSAEAAEAIAEADALVDILGLPRNHYHMRPRFLLGRDQRRERAGEHLQKAIAAASHGDCDDAFHHLGYGLHALQDAEAHGPWWLLGVHWFAWLDDPERTIWGRKDQNMTRLHSLEKVTKDYLLMAMADGAFATCVKGTRMPGT